MSTAIKIYTDGAARGNPGPAGWGVVFLVGDKVIEFGGRSDHATNNQMELTAAIEALKQLKQISQKSDFWEGVVEIYADSKYVILGITDWIFGWQKNNWRNAAKKPVMNRELWEELFALTQNYKLKWQYVAGHGTDKWNNRADEIATSFADKEPVKLSK